MIRISRTGTPGVATGLAWTPTGGEILFIEASGMPGKGTLTLTGLFGESMRESAQAAMSYLRSHSRPLGIDAARFRGRCAWLCRGKKSLIYGR